jgi:hypothetical protein
MRWVEHAARMGRKSNAHRAVGEKIRIVTKRVLSKVDEHTWAKFICHW